MTQKGKSPIEQAVRAAHALAAIEEWDLEWRREDVERMEKTFDMGRPASDWSAFVARAAGEYVAVRDLAQIEIVPLPPLPDEGYFTLCRVLFAMAFGVPGHLP